ncbi:MAG: HEAT repeat domain-containing protein [Candidatus Methylacidiphilales bacterium]|nr:HEAT repeat domain-containing protein [Candidatus Methylacidiphilales bacterium]
MTSRVALIIAGGVTFVALCVGLTLFLLTGGLVDTATLKAMDDPEKWDKTTTDTEAAVKAAPTDLQKQRTLLYIYLKGSRPEAAFLVYNEHIKQPNPAFFDLLDKDKDPVVRAQALLMYDIIQTKEPVDPVVLKDVTGRMVKAATDTDESVRQNAAKALQRSTLDQPEIDAALVSILTKDTAYLIRDSALTALNTRFDLARAVKDDAARKAWCVRIAGPLMPLATDSDPMIAKPVCDLIMRIGLLQGAAIHDVVVKATEDTSKRQGQMALHILFSRIRAGDASAAKALQPVALRLLKSKDPQERAMAAGMFSSMTDPRETGTIELCKPIVDEAYPVVQPLLVSTDPADRMFGVQILAAIRNPQFAPEASKFLDDAEPAVRLAAIQAVGSCRYTASLPRLKALAADASQPGQIHDMAGKAIAYMTQSDKPQGDGEAQPPATEPAPAAKTPAKTPAKKKNK